MIEFIALLLLLVCLTIYMASSFPSTFYFNGAVCVRGECQGDDCYSSLAECKEEISYCCADKCAATAGKHCFDTRAKCMAKCTLPPHPTGSTQWIWRVDAEKCAEVEKCPSGVTCYSSLDKCNSDVEFCCEDKCATGSHVGSSGQVDVGCFRDAASCIAGCTGSQAAKWIYSSGKCSQVAECPTGAACYPSLSKCEGDVEFCCQQGGICGTAVHVDPSGQVSPGCFRDAASCTTGCSAAPLKWFYDSAANVCKSGPTCPATITDGSCGCFNTEELCLSNCSADTWIWDKSTKTCRLANKGECTTPSDANRKVECYDSEVACNNAHHVPQSSWYSIDAISDKCLVNPDCTDSSDRTFCVSNPSCAGAPRIPSGDIPASWPKSTVFVVAPRAANGDLTKLPFDTVKFPVFKSDHEQNLAVEGDALVVTYGKCDRPDTSECKYGSQFWSAPSAVPSNLDSAVLHYEVFFPADFDSVHGGKLPGLYGLAGTAVDFKKNKHCTHCTGSAPSNGVLCWSARPMWRAGMFGEVLIVIPVDHSKRGWPCDMKETTIGVNNGYLFNDAEKKNHTTCSSSWGCDLARGAFQWPKGSWTSVEIWAQLNTPTSDGTAATATAATHDGVFAMRVGGQLVMYFDNLLYRYSPNLHINGLLFSTFFGGGSPSTYAPKTEQQVKFRNFRIFYA